MIEFVLSCARCRAEVRYATADGSPASIGSLVLKWLAGHEADVHDGPEAADDPESRARAAFVDEFAERFVDRWQETRPLVARAPIDLTLEAGDEFSIESTLEVSR